VRGIGILDYDHDGLMDIFFTNGAKLPELKKTNSSFYNCLLRNKGDGTFEDVTKKAGVSGENPPIMSRISCTSIKGMARSKRPDYSTVWHTTRVALPYRQWAAMLRTTTTTDL
jgi:FG-GAP-like repeat